MEPFNAGWLSLLPPVAAIVAASHSKKEALNPMYGRQAHR